MTPLKPFLTSLLRDAVAALPLERQQSLAKTAWRCGQVLQDATSLVGEVRQAWPTAEEGAIAARRLLGRGLAQVVEKLASKND